MRRLLPRHVLAVAWIAALAACTVHAEDKSKGIIEVSVREGKGTLPDGPRLYLDMLLSNTSRSQLLAFEQSDERDYEIDIRDPGGAPVTMTNWGACALREPHDVFRNIMHKLEPGEKDRTTTILLNELFKLDRVGSYYVTVQRRVLQAPQGHPISFNPLPNCQPLTLCTTPIVVYSDPLSFWVDSPYPDVSPYVNPVSCLRYEVKEAK